MPAILIVIIPDICHYGAVNWPPACAVVIPCFNEGRHIARVVGAARAHLPEVFVIDDGSQDNTAEEAGNAGAHTLRHDCNQGKGAALATGLSVALEKGFTWAVVMDGDGQHSPEDIPALLVCAENTGATLVIGNRMSAARGMPLVRRLVNRWMSRRISARAGCWLPDTQCGFRLINLRVWQRLELRTQRFEIESEILLAFVGAHQRVEFVPIKVIYKDEQSKIRPWADTVRWFRWWRRSAKASPQSGLAFDGPLADLQKNSHPAVK